MRTSVLSIAAAVLTVALFAAQPIAAQTTAGTANWSAGAKVSDTGGGEVGTIGKVDGDFVILKTDKHEVRLPKTSFTAANGGFIMAMTRDQVNAAVEQTLAQADQKITVGASVSGSEGAAVGTIDAVDDEMVRVKLTSGKLVRLPRSGVAPGPSGAVIGMTAAELEAAATQAAPAGETAAAAAADDED